MRNNFLKKCGIASVDLQLMGSNLLIWSPTKLFDPEQARYNGRKYPLPARYTFQVYIIYKKTEYATFIETIYTHTNLML